MPTVVGLAITPVKATRLREVDRIELGPDGVRENRRFYVIDDRDRMINGKHRRRAADRWSPTTRTPIAG